MLSYCAFVSSSPAPPPPWLRFAKFLLQQHRCCRNLRVCAAACTELQHGHSRGHGAKKSCRKSEARDGLGGNRNFHHAHPEMENLCNMHGDREMLERQGGP